MDFPLIVSDSKILRGKPIIKGTRISVEFILELVASGVPLLRLPKVTHTYQ